MRTFGTITENSIAFYHSFLLAIGYRRNSHCFNNNCNVCHKSVLFILLRILYITSRWVEKVSYGLVSQNSQLYTHSPIMQRCHFDFQTNVCDNDVYSRLKSVLIVDKYIYFIEMVLELSSL